MGGDYLNFFEFVAGLKAMKQLSLHEIKMLFEYYIRLLKRHDFVVKFIENQSFENLNKTLKDDFKT